MPITRDSVRTYYDQNTKLFAAFGNSNTAQNIHRGLWTDGAKTFEEALNITNEWIRREIVSIAPTHAQIADLGCGVGAGLFYIFPRLTEPEYALGVTLSPLQARLAGQSARQLNLSSQILFAESDFTRVPLEKDSLDAVYSVEAVAHALDPESYFCEASRLLRDRGRLILLDDYQASRTMSPGEEGWLNSFINGWHVPGVRTVEQSQAFAERYNLQLIRNDDLTPFLRLRNLPNTLAKFLRFLGTHLPIKHAILPSMLGSMALQQCLHLGVIEYRFLVFEKS
jgi:SAM-dependent methyltransferase